MCVCVSPEFISFQSWSTRASLHRAESVVFVKGGFLQSIPRISCLIEQEINTYKHLDKHFWNTHMYTWRFIDDWLQITPFQKSFQACSTNGTIKEKLIWGWTSLTETNQVVIFHDTTFWIENPLSALPCTVFSHWAKRYLIKI